MVPERGIHPCKPTPNTQKATPNATPNGLPVLTLAEGVTLHRDSHVLEYDGITGTARSIKRAGRDKRYREVHKAKRSAYMRDYMRKRRAERA